ncbi:hypothetical protein Q5752_001373 [Cryptotrichosporon argae]
MAEPSTDEIVRRCQDLVYKVAYSFYDSPYIILLRVLSLQNVMSEKALSDMLGITPGEVRKYLGMLHVHRLVKRHVNKERIALTSFQQRQVSSGATLAGVELDPSRREMSKLRDVIYWYLDYREFADVVKLRLAVMRKAIDEKVKQETGQRGYICPSCGTTYDPLDLSHLFDATAGAFLCEVCSSELVEDDPALHLAASGANDADGTGADAPTLDRMQRFNRATAPVRDALKALENLRLPSTNIVAWIAVNVKAEQAADAAKDEGRRVDVVIGAGDDEDKKRALAEAQRAQNALPIWYTHSTITNEATSLGHKAAADTGAAGPGRAHAHAGHDDDDGLARHFAELEDGGAGEAGPSALVGAHTAAVRVKAEPAVEAAIVPATAVADDDDDDLDEPDAPAREDGRVMVSVNGTLKPLDEVDEDDEAAMTPDEYEKYYAAAAAAL